MARELEKMALKLGLDTAEFSKQGQKAIDKFVKGVKGKTKHTVWVDVKTTVDETVERTVVEKTKPAISKAVAGTSPEYRSQFTHYSGQGRPKMNDEMEEQLVETMKRLLENEDDVIAYANQLNQMIMKLHDFNIIKRSQATAGKVNEKELTKIEKEKAKEGMVKGSLESSKWGLWEQINKHAAEEQSKQDEYHKKKDRYLALQQLKEQRKQTKMQQGDGHKQTGILSQLQGIFRFWLRWRPGTGFYGGMQGFDVVEKGKKLWELGKAGYQGYKGAKAAKAAKAAGTAGTTATTGAAVGTGATAGATGSAGMGASIGAGIVAIGAALTSIAAAISAVIGVAVPPLLVAAAILAVILAQIIIFVGIIAAVLAILYVIGKAIAFIVRTVKNSEAYKFGQDFIAGPIESAVAFFVWGIFKFIDMVLDFFNIDPVEELKKTWKFLTMNVNEEIGKIVKIIITFLVNLGVTIWEKVIKPVIILIGETLAKIPGAVLEFIDNKVQQLKDRVMKFIETLKVIWETIKAVWEVVKEFLPAIGNRIKEVFEEVKNKIIEKWNDLKEKVVEAVKSAIGKATEFKDKVVAVFKTIGNIIKWFLDMWKGLFYAIGDMFKWVAESIKKVFSWLVDSIKYMFIALNNTIVDKLPALAKLLGMHERGNEKPQDLSDLMKSIAKDMPLSGAKEYFPSIDRALTEANSSGYAGAY